MNEYSLPEHPAFYRLTRDEKELLRRSAELWEAPQGAVVHHPGDSAEELLLLLEGEWVCGEMRFFPGELWGEERLVAPQPLQTSFVCHQNSRWLRWRRQTLLSLLASHPHLRRHLTLRKDDQGKRLSGFSHGLPAVFHPQKRRRIRPSFRLLVGSFLFVVSLLFLLILLPLGQNFWPISLALLALWVGWALVEIVRIYSREYSWDMDDVSSRHFLWNRMSLDSRRVPLEQIQGVRLERPGLLRRLLDVGTLCINTASIEGELVLENVLHPAKLAEEIKNLRGSSQTRHSGREREDLRRALEASEEFSHVPRMVQMGQREEHSNEFMIKFRKSPILMLRSLLIPFAIALVLGVVFHFFGNHFGNGKDYFLFLFLLPGVWGFFCFEDWRNDYYRLEGAVAVDVRRKPLGLQESIIKVNLLSVQNVRMEQNGVFAFLFGYGDVILVTAGSASDAVFSGVQKPWQVQDALFQRREEELRRKEEEQRLKQREDMIRFAQAMDQIRGN